MSNGSGLFTKQSAQKPHLLRGSGGIQSEIADLRSDVLEEMAAVAAITAEELTNVAAADADGIKTSIASSASAASYSGAALNGVVGAGTMSPPRNITITTSSNANINAVAVVITGKDVNGATQTDTITLTDNGGVTDVGTKAFASVSSIAVPAQGGTGGALQFGFGNVIGLSKKLKARAGSNGLIREIVAGSVAQVPADVAVDEWTDPVALDTAGLEALTATTVAPRTVLAAGLIAGGKTALLTYPRNVTFTNDGSGTPGDAPASALVTGTDINDAVLTETILVPQTATTVEGVKAFKTIVSVAYAAGDGTGAMVSIGFGKKLGLRYPLKLRAGASKVIQEIEAGTVVTTGTFVLPATSDPNGTYSPSTSPDGSKDYAVYYEAATSAGSVVVSAASSGPNGTYAPNLTPNGTRDYTIYYEYDPTA